MTRVLNKRHLTRKQQEEEMNFIRQQGEVFKYFYPGMLPHSFIRAENVADLMNISKPAATRFMNQVCKALRIREDKFVLIRLFCEYLDIDLVLTQLFLASLREE